jgi:hypothetical protein
MVRRSRRESPEARVERIVSDWEIELGKRLPRPRVLAGDLTMPRCGLSDADLGWVARHCSGLLHNAASLSFRGSDRAAEPWLSNVTGAAHVLDVAKLTDIEHFHHVSTAYVCGLRAGTIAEDDLDVGQDFGNDYERSKVEAETMIRAAAGPASVTVYRPSIIVGDSSTGFTSTYHGLFAVLRLGHTLLAKVPLGTTSGPAIIRLLGAAPSHTKNFAAGRSTSPIRSQSRTSLSARSFRKRSSATRRPLRRMIRNCATSSGLPTISPPNSTSTAPTSATTPPSTGPTSRPSQATSPARHSIIHG